MDEKTFKVFFVLMDTHTASGTSKEDVQKSAESMIRETYGCIHQHKIVRILPHEEDVQKPLLLEDVLKVVEPLREWPSPAAIAAHKKRGGRWLFKEESSFSWIPPLVKIGVFYEDEVFMGYGKALSSIKFGPVDENYNRCEWPKDKEGNLL